MAPNLDAFDHVHIHVADRVAAEAWYGKVLGLFRTDELAFWAADGGPLTIQNQSGTIHLALFERSPRGGHSTIALRVNATEYLHWRAHLHHVLAGEFSEADHAVSLSLYFRDPDGNPFEITSYEYQQVKAGATDAA